ncbi:DUF1697 domain-containing protein [Aquimarina mytili]|uniref:DUF1697 domain-containing protein n=1 Tax=Aquimarina mytili TaxID=874423 RepID=A0A936ZU31_9FLAO|nr:DUF1697 domain-containing protein [Aquimarina mytili]MBL0682161.1 DUF1697 domain-containing protein [Aquimarina mytili]
MKIYIALLRGINVSGQKKIKMIDLKAMLEGLRLTSVTTYIQSGNIVFKSEKKDTQILSDLIKNGISTRFGFDVPVLVLTPEILTNIYEENPFSDGLLSGEIEDKKMYFTLLSNPPDANAVAELMAKDFKEERFEITSKVVYFYAANGYGKTKLTNNFFEKKLKCDATTRNCKTVIKLLELSKLT